ncbi:DUF397 domain-containing protein [Saccharopolyspora sp. 6M]|nr:DUF397 domain-containing protein [Saccharopolyspora sp. 6M]
MASAEQTSGWRKSSRSQNTSACIEVGRTLAGNAALRDTKNPSGGHIITHRQRWASFIAAVKSGKYDR